MFGGAKPRGPELWSDLFVSESRLEVRQRHIPRTQQETLELKSTSALASIR